MDHGNNGLSPLNIFHSFNLNIKNAVCFRIEISCIFNKHLYLTKIAMVEFAVEVLVCCIQNLPTHAQTIERVSTTSGRLFQSLSGWSYTIAGLAKNFVT